jgi:hypothetical protein
LKFCILKWFRKLLLIFAALCLSQIGFCESTKVTVEMPETMGVPIHFNGPVTIPTGTLSGMALFKDGIILENSQTVLTLDFLSPLYTLLDLNGGTIILGSDLCFSNFCKLPSKGTIEGNGKSFLLRGDLVVEEEILVKSDLTIDGSLHKIKFIKNGRLTIEDGVTMTLKNVTFDNKVSQTPLLCNGPNSRIIVNGATLNLGNNFELGQGYMLIESAHIKGPYEFKISTTKGSKIASSGLLSVTDGAILRFDEKGLAQNRSLLTGEDSTSVLLLSCATLSSAKPGLMFDVGTILADNDVKIISDGQTEEEAISLLNPKTLNESTLKLLAAANVELIGHLKAE